MVKVKSLYAYLMMSFLILVNVWFSYYFIFGDGQGELTFMGFISLITAIIITLLMIRFYRFEKRQNMKNFNAHIKSDDDRILK